MFHKISFADDVIGDMITTMHLSFSVSFWSIDVYWVFSKNNFPFEWVFDWEMIDLRLFSYYCDAFHILLL